MGIFANTGRVLGKRGAMPALLGLSPPLRLLRLPLGWLARARLPRRLRLLRLPLRWLARARLPRRQRASSALISPTTSTPLLRLVAAQPGSTAQVMA